MSDNNVTVVGNVVRDPALKYTTSNLAILELSVAVNERVKKDGEYTNVPSFFDVTAFGDLAEQVASSIEKGDRVVVSGKLKQSSWETQEGQKRSKVGITADDVAASMRFATVEITKAEKSSR